MKYLNIDSWSRKQHFEYLIPADHYVYCSALPWLHFSGHKEPASGIRNESVPKRAFEKFLKKEGRSIMPVSVAIHHALVDGYHAGRFFERFQKELDKIN